MIHEKPTIKRIIYVVLIFKVEFDSVSEREAEDTKNYIQNQMSTTNWQRHGKNKKRLKCQTTVYKTQYRILLETDQSRVK